MRNCMQWKEEEKIISSRGENKRNLGKNVGDVRRTQEYRIYRALYTHFSLVDRFSAAAPSGFVVMYASWRWVLATL